MANIKRTSTAQKIVACNECGSTGIVAKWQSCVRGSIRDYEHWNEICSHCDGEGRLLEVTITYTVTFTDGRDTMVSETNRAKLNGRKTADIYAVRTPK